MLRAEIVNKIYRDGKKKLHVLKEIDLDLSKGEIAALVGPSGAGKSTLLHILGGLDRPTSGKVYLDNLDIYKFPDKKRASLRNEKIGFVFQFYHLLPEFTALENVIMPALIKAQRFPRLRSGQAKLNGQEIKKKAEELLRGFGLGERLLHRPSELSGGEQQRIAIARALINEPSVLLCDEPTGNLDSEMGEEILKILFALNKKYMTTVVIVTHDVQIAKRASRTIQIKDGQII